MSDKRCGCGRRAEIESSPLCYDCLVEAVSGMSREDFGCLLVDCESASPKTVWALKYRNEEGCDEVFVTLYAARLDAYLGLLAAALDAGHAGLTEVESAQKEAELVDIIMSGQEHSERHGEWLEWVELFDHLWYWDVEPLELPEAYA